MAYGKELHFGYANTKDSFKAANNLWLDVIDLGTDEVIDYEYFKVNAGACRPDIDGNQLESKLTESYESVLNRLGWKFGPAKMPGGRSDRYRTVQSPWGIRESGVWSLESVYDPFEMGDEHDDLTLGVNISSRYFPSILDMKSSCGGLGNIFVWDDETRKITDICREEIVKAIPGFDNAVFFLRDIHY